MDTRNTILIVDDEQNTLEGLKAILLQEGYQVVTALSAEKALEALQNTDIDVVITDLMLQGTDGMAFARLVIKEYFGTQVIIMTAFGTVRSAVEAMKEGVYNYLTKPVDIDELLVVTKKALEESRLRKENIDLKSKLEAKYTFKNIIGSSGALLGVFEKVMKVAKTNTTVLLRGESGTGKELVAHAIHEHSARADKPFVEINCPSFPDTLLESELFGYERGAFTGAYKTKLGRVEAADGGTIFLDEIGEINPAVQVKLLRILQERTFTRLGSTEIRSIDVRVIATTNANLENAMKEGRFREDLYYRLNVIPIILPPLRERKGDIPLLIDHFIKKYAVENNKQPMKLSDEAMQVLFNYHWPGNIREIENAIENVIVMCDKSTIGVEDLPQYLTAHRGHMVRVTADASFDYTNQLEETEKQLIREALEQSGGNKTRAAEILGISLRTLHYKVKKYRL